MFNPRLWTAAPRLPAAQGVKFRLRGDPGDGSALSPERFPSPAASKCPTRGAGSRGSCQRQVQGLLRVGFICELARLGSCMDYSCWHPRKLLMAQGAASSAAKREQTPARSAGAAAAAAEAGAGAGAAGQPRSRPGSRAGACQQLGSSFSMRQQLGEAPGPRCSEQAPLSPSAAVWNLDLPRGTDNPRGWGCSRDPSPATSR